jgi:hypothetical protein
MPPRVQNGIAIPPGMQEHARRMIRLLARVTSPADRERWSESEDAVTQEWQYAEDMLAEYLSREFAAVLLAADSECSAVASHRSVDIDTMHQISRLCRQAYECR